METKSGELEFFSLELIADPDRLGSVRPLLQNGQRNEVRIAISRDTPSRSDLNFMRFRVDQVRRGWLEAKDIINTRSLKELKKILQR